MKTFISIILLSVFISSLSAQKADLKLNLELNKTYRAKLSSTVNTKQTVQGNEQSNQVINTMVISLTPLKSDKDGIISQVQFDTIITKISTPQMEVNSANKGDIRSCIVNRLSNSTLLVKLSNKGEVDSIMNIEQVASTVLQDIDSMEGNLAPFLKSRAEMMVNKESLKSMIEVFTAYLPGEKIKVGDKWDSKLTSSSGGMNMKVNTTYKLNDVSKDAAEITGDVITESDQSEPMKMNGAEILPDISGLGKTEITADPHTGWIIKGTNKQQLKGDLNVNAQGNSMQIPMEINSVAEINALQ